jgi:hypothetical protein
LLLFFKKEALAFLTLLSVLQEEPQHFPAGVRAGFAGEAAGFAAAGPGVAGAVQDPLF